MRSVTEEALPASQYVVLDRGKQVDFVHQLEEHLYTSQSQLGPFNLRQVNACIV